MGKIREKAMECAIKSADANHDEALSAQELGRAYRNKLSWTPCTAHHYKPAKTFEQMLDKAKDGLTALQRSGKHINIELDVGAIKDEIECSRNFKAAKDERCSKWPWQRAHPGSLMDPDMPPEGPSGCGKHFDRRRDRTYGCGR